MHLHCSVSQIRPDRAYTRPQKTETPSTNVTEDPIWVRREKEQKANREGGGLFFGVYLLLSAIVAIAAVRR